MWRWACAHSRTFLFQADDGIRYPLVTGVQTCALPISAARGALALLKISREQRPAVASLVGACVLTLFVGMPAWAAFQSAPHYALYTNALAPNGAGDRKSVV